MPWISTARMTKITLAGSPGRKPALIMRTSPAPTMRIRPSTSKPIWVIQLKNEIGREPFGPKGARLMAKTVVPASGPLQRAQPEQEVREVAEDDDDEAWAK